MSMRHEHGTAIICSLGPSVRCPERRCSCAMSLMGVLNHVPGTSLFVDHFQHSGSTSRLHPGAVFFFTHCHSDHMNGLAPGWRLGELHKSTGTAPFLQRTFGAGLPGPLKTYPAATHNSSKLSVPFLLIPPHCCSSKI